MSRPTTQTRELRPRGPECDHRRLMCATASSRATPKDDTIASAISPQKLRASASPAHENSPRERRTDSCTRYSNSNTSASIQNDAVCERILSPTSGLGQTVLNEESVQVRLRPYTHVLHVLGRSHTCHIAILLRPLIRLATSRSPPCPSAPSFAASRAQPPRRISTQASRKGDEGVPFCLESRAAGGRRRPALRDLCGLLCLRFVCVAG
jgi:hypothetical protein